MTTPFVSKLIIPPVITTRVCFYAIAKNSKVKNLHVDGKIKVGNARMVGGIAGDNYGTIENCWVSADVESDHYSTYDADLGGIAGWNESGGKIRYCCMTGNVTNTDGNSGVGGIAGSNDGTIEHVTLYGSVSVDHEQDNKWVGDQDETLSNYYDSFNSSEYDAASDYDLYRKAIKYTYDIKVTNAGPGNIQVSAGGENNVSGARKDQAVTLTKTSGTATRIDIKDADGNWVYSNGDINGTLTFTMPKKAVNITAYFWADWPTQGAGTAEDPYIISSAEDWNRFAHNVTLGRTYSGSHVKLTNNISVSNPAGGSTTYSFQSTFDSDGHTLTFNNSGWTEKFIAPFR